MLEFLLAVLLVYVEAIQFAINTRPISIPHFMIPGVSYAILILFYDETRKLYVRRGMVRTSGPEGTLIKFPGWIARNTYY